MINRNYKHSLQYFYNSLSYEIQLILIPQKQQMITFAQILGCNGTVIYQIIGTQMNFITSGRLQVLLAYDGMVILKLNEFEYAINGSQTILYDKEDPQFHLVLYFKKNSKDQWIVKINQNTDQVESCLGEKCYLKNKRQKYSVQEQKQKQLRNLQKPEKVFAKRQVVLDEQQEQQQNNNLAVGAAKQINKGLKFAGGVLSTGFQSLGSFISKKVTKEQNKQVKEQTKDNLKFAKETSKHVFQFTSQQVGNLFSFGKKVATSIGERFQKSQKGKDLQEHPHYQTVKKGAKTGVGVIANLYDGVVGAVYAVGSGVAKGATKIVKAKYGQDAGEAVDEALQGAGNVVKIARVPVDQAADKLK